MSFVFVSLFFALHEKKVRKCKLAKQGLSDPMKTYAHIYIHYIFVTIKYIRHSQIDAIELKSNF